MNTLGTILLALGGFMMFGSFPISRLAKHFGKNIGWIARTNRGWLVAAMIAAGAILLAAGIHITDSFYAR